MDSERWHRVEQVYHSALKIAADQRAVFLHDECQDDEELRKEVESLLSYEDSAADFIESPAFTVAAKLVAENTLQDQVADHTAGRVVAQRFRIVERLGGGGMGIVYKAEDTKLRRSVALKFLPSELSRDPQALERFQREAYAASALNHPNICTVHDVDEYEEQPFIAMELLEGETLESRIGRKPLPTAELLDLAVQISDGLEAAHARGIVHRDIKPSNIFVTTPVQCKILDFGLAKLQDSEADERKTTTAQPVPDEDLLSNLPLTRTGVAIGTAGYMSPEQIRGEKLDLRTDVFSFGLVLYEMATGLRAFQGETGPALHAAILGQTPTPARKLNPQLPAKLELVISKALEKNRQERYQHISEMRADLEKVKREIAPSSPIRWWAMGVGTIALLLIVGTNVWLLKRQPKSSPALADVKLTQLTTNAPENPVAGGAISRDGKYLAYADTRGVHIKLIGSDEIQNVPEPDGLKNGSVVWDIASPSWFPDGKRLLVNTHPSAESPNQWSAQTSTVWLVTVLGGPPRKLRDQAMAWDVSPDGSWIAFTTNFVQGQGYQGEKEMWLMAPDGTQAHKFIESDGKSAVCCLHFFPEQHRIGYIISNSSGDTFVTRDLNGGPETPIFQPSQMKSMGDGTWLPRGKWLYSDNCGGPTGMRGDDPCNFWIKRVDLRTGKVIEPARRLTNWFGSRIVGPSATADGKRVAFRKGFHRGVENYVADLEMGGTRLANLRRIALEESGLDFVSDWTADGKTLILTHLRNDHYELSKQALSSDEREPVVANGPGLSERAFVTADSKWIMIQVWPIGGNATAHTIVKLMRVPFEGGAPELVFPVREGSSAFCARRPSDQCVVAELSENERDLTVTAFDPVKGRGSELARFTLAEDTGLGVDHLVLFDLSPDGSRFALARSPKGPIEIHSLRGVQTLIIPTTGLDSLHQIRWAADGEGLFVSTHKEDSGQLLHLDMRGKANVIWPYSCGTNPSPDGRYLAINDSKQDTNMFMMENF